MSRIVDIEPLLKKYDGMNEGTEFSPIHFINDLMALEQLLYGQPKQTCIEDYPTCTECEHYDHKKHYCPRFCQVIKDTLAEAQPSEDCISRENILDYIAKLLSGYLYEEERERLEDFTAYIAEMPSVTPQRPKGKWIEVSDYGYQYHFECSACGKRMKSNDDTYCPNCGAEMSGGGEDEDSD